MMTVIMTMMVRARANLAKARARVALTRAMMIRADKDDSRIRVALPWVTTSDDDKNDDDKGKVGAGKPTMMMARVR
jgi:hypothetical protein